MMNLLAAVKHIELRHVVRILLSELRVLADVNGVKPNRNLIFGVLVTLTPQRTSDGFARIAPGRAELDHGEGAGLEDGIQALAGKWRDAIADGFAGRVVKILAGTRALPRDA